MTETVVRNKQKGRRVKTEFKPFFYVRFRVIIEMIVSDVEFYKQIFCERKQIVAVALILLSLLSIFNLTGCGIKISAQDLTEGYEPESVYKREPDKAFIDSQTDFSVNLFKITANNEGENILISPLSVGLALAMTANGADSSYVNSLDSGEKYKVSIANSIWFRDDENRLSVEKDFLQTNANYYSAQIYKSPFDKKTARDINNWVKLHTDKTIDKIVDEINPNAVMYLINALAFDAEWEHVYEKSDITNGTFTSYGGEKQDTEMMISDEHLYLCDEKATGFIKNYSGGKYGFAALLPNEGIDIYEYIQGLTGEKLQNTLDSAKSSAVKTTMPKFSYEYESSLNDALKKLGMNSAFDESKADFSKMGKSSNGNLYISEVKHKTFICVDERGTKAGAVTSVTIENGAEDPMSMYSVKLDRPFVYMIIDNDTNLPLFIGAVTDIN